MLQRRPGQQSGQSRRDLQPRLSAKEHLRAAARARGVAADRLAFADRVKPDDHLARHRLADLFLDTLPVPAHTTASDALWAGLPLLTCVGSGFVGRVGASLLRAIGLPELVTNTLEEYEALALKLAHDPSMLGGLKSRLWSNRSHPLAVRHQAPRAPHRSRVRGHVGASPTRGTAGELFDPSRRRDVLSPAEFTAVTSRTFCRSPPTNGHAALRRH